MKEDLKLLLDWFHLTNPEGRQEFLNRLGRSPYGDHALRKLPRLNRPDLEILSHYPQGTLGEHYFSSLNSTSPLFQTPASTTKISIPIVDVDSFVVVHLLETHELWKIATGFNSSDIGICGLNGFYLGQLGSPAVLANAMYSRIIKLTESNPLASDGFLSSMINGWILGRRAKPLFGFEWQNHWNQPLESLRRDLGLPANEKDLLKLSEIQKLLHDTSGNLDFTGSAGGGRSRLPFSDL